MKEFGLPVIYRNNKYEILDFSEKPYYKSDNLRVSSLSEVVKYPELLSRK